MKLWFSVASLAATPEKLTVERAQEIVSNPTLRSYPGEVAGTALLFANILSQQGKQDGSMSLLKTAYESLMDGPASLHRTSLFRVLLPSNALELPPEDLVVRLRETIQLSQGRVGLRDLVQLRLLLIKSLLVTQKRNEILPELLEIIEETSSQASIPPFLWTLRVLTLSLLVNNGDAPQADIMALAELVPAPDSMKPTHEWLGRFIEASTEKEQMRLIQELTETLFGLPPEAG